MAFQDVGVEVLVLAAADGLDEVGEVIGVLAAAELRDLAAVLVEGRAAGVAVEHDVAVAAFEDHADAGALEVLRLQAADLEDQRLVP